MALTLGNFDASAYTPIKEKAYEFISSDNWSKQWTGPVDIFQGLAASQMIRLAGTRIQTLADKRYCQLHTVTYLQDEASAPITLADSVADCTIGGEEIGSLSKDYATAEILRIGKKVIHKTCKDIFDFNEKSALALENLKNQADLDAENKAIAFVVANTKVLSSLNTSIGTVVGSDWSVPAANVDAEFIAELMFQAKQLKMISPMLFLNKNYYKDKIIADATVGKTNDASALLTAIPNAHDTLNFDALSGGNRFYLVDMASLFYINSTEYMNVLPESVVTDSYFMKTASRRLSWADGGSLKPVEYDLIMQRKCTGASFGNDYSDVWNLVHSGAFGESPQTEGTTTPNIVQITVT